MRARLARRAHDHAVPPDADGPADTSMMVNNVIDSFQLTETQIGSPADFKAWIKEYMNAIRGQMKEKGLGKEKFGSQEFECQI